MNWTELNVLMVPFCSFKMTEDEWQRREMWFNVEPAHWSSVCLSVCLSVTADSQLFFTGRKGVYCSVSSHRHEMFHIGSNKANFHLRIVHDFEKWRTRLFTSERTKLISDSLPKYNVKTQIPSCLLTGFLYTSEFFFKKITDKQNWQSSASL